MTNENLPAADMELGCPVERRPQHLQLLGAQGGQQAGILERGIGKCETRRGRELNTHNSLSSGQLIDVDYDLDIGVDLPDLDVDVLPSDLLGLELDQPDPLPPQVGGRLVHLGVAVLQVLGDCAVNHLRYKRSQN